MRKLGIASTPIILHDTVDKCFDDIFLVVKTGQLIEDFLERTFLILSLQLGEVPVCYNLSICQQHNSVTDVFHQFHDMRREENGFPLSSESLEYFFHYSDTISIQPFNGSSKKITSGLCSKLETINTFCRMPFEKLSIRL